jgi:hypothetical protein
VHVARLMCGGIGSLTSRPRAREFQKLVSVSIAGQTEYTSNLLGLLGDTLLLSTSVAVDVSQISGLLDTALETTPGLSDGRRQVLTSGNGITTSAELVDGRLHKGALVEASSKEDGVDSDQDPRALLEEESREAQTEPQSDLEDSDKSHGRIVVVLNEVANGVGKAGRLGLLASSDSRLGLEGGQKV